MVFLGKLMIEAVISGISSIGFGIITNVSRRALPSIGLVGSLGWVVYWLCNQTFMGSALANLVAACVISLASSYFARRNKMPMTILIIPSIVSLVPGGTAYQAIRSFVSDEDLAGLGYAVDVVVTAAALAAGFLLAKLITESLHRLKRAN